MKLALVTRSDDNVKAMTDVTHPIIKKYAEKCNAEFIILTDDKKPPESHWRILQLYKLLDDYDRVIIMDSDIIIKKDCPNLFEVVPEDCIGTVFEDVGSRQSHRRQLIEQVQKERNDVGWRSGYINTGVFVVSKMHKEIFNLDITKVWRGFGEDDVELGYQIRKFWFNIFELDYHFNMMSLFTEKGESRFNGFMIHFAGNGHWPFLTNTDEIKQDMALLKNLGLV